MNGNRNVKFKINKGLELLYHKFLVKKSSYLCFELNLYFELELELELAS